MVPGICKGLCAPSGQSALLYAPSAAKHMPNGTWVLLVSSKCFVGVEPVFNVFQESLITLQDQTLSEFLGIFAFKQQFEVSPIGINAKKKEKLQFLKLYCYKN